MTRSRKSMDRSGVAFTWRETLPQTRPRRSAGKHGKIGGRIRETRSLGPYKLKVESLTSRRRSLAGSSIGGIRETQEMLDFCAESGIAPEIETISAGNVDAAYDRVVRSDVRYRFVIDMATLSQAGH